MTVSAAECAASETIAAEPPTTPATSFASAMQRFISAAMITVITLSDLTSAASLMDPSLGEANGAGRDWCRIGLLIRWSQVRVGGPAEAKGPGAVLLRPALSFDLLVGALVQTVLPIPLRGCASYSSPRKPHSPTL
ncbi:hypothetical protein GCM10010403_11650 [Glycomyces rutgersensis]|uniref:Uncharacterized protein n=1 Tax=Glycomyces rutgersensis TaxID=58115 RepID=A0ABN3F8H5_9ACTN